MRPRSQPPRGVTLVELMVVIAILAVVVAAITKAIVDVYRTQAVRTVTVRAQGEGRDGLRRVEHELRAASLGAPFGVIWTQDSAGSVVPRPAVQLYDNVTANSPTVDLKIKAGTDALLVVGGVGLGVEGATQGTVFVSTAAPPVLTVTDVTPFKVGQQLLMGPFKSAAWNTIKTINAGTSSLALSQNLLPDGKLESGSWIHEAKATLFFVDASDELVEQEVLVPRGPASMDELGTRRVLARGVEDLQLDCELDDGVAFQPCPAGSVSGALADEGKVLFGKWGTVGGPRFTEVNISTLRTVTLSVVVRSERELANQLGGDKPISIDAQTTVLTVGGAEDQQHVRRAYRLPVAVRNVALGAL
jgi:prepilin-type N-terminal cleavage/methylation domain-containing protein